MASGRPPAPRLAPGMRLMHWLHGGRFGYSFYQLMALVLTFFVYMSYHASRRPISIVKSELNPGGGGGCCGNDCSASGVQSARMLGESVDEGWAPFTGKCGESRLGYLDTSFLIAYTVGVFSSGHRGDRTNLRHFLLFGMVGSGVMISLVGLAYFWSIHNYGYFLLFQALTGIFEGTGWPIVVSVVAHWFGKGRRGLIMGIWNSHTSVGNMLGSFLAASVVSSGWGYSFLLLAAVIAGVGVISWLFLVSNPAEVNYEAPDATTHASERACFHEDHEAICEELLPSDSPIKPPQEGISFMDAFRIPGILAFSFALFFSKLVAYTFLFWLPFYLTEDGSDATAKQAGDLSILFDLGGIFGGIAAGQLSDVTGASASVATGFTLLAMPAILIYKYLGTVSGGVSNFLLVVTGFFVNAPYALITTAVSADLGTHESIAGNQNALSTVTAIIDGMGSLGATVGPLLTGQILSSGGTTAGAFNKMFMMLSGSSLMAGILLCGQVQKEWKTRRKEQDKREPTEVEGDCLSA